MKVQLYLYDVIGKKMNKKGILLIITISITILIFISLFISNKERNIKLNEIIKEINVEEISVKNGATEKLALLAKEGNPIAMYRYSEILIDENKVNEAINYLELLFEAGDEKATVLLGITYIESTEKKLKGFNLLNKLAKKGSSTSQLYLGVCFTEKECPLPKNEYLAFYWLTLAEKSGESDASFLLKITESKNQIISSKKQKEETQKIICKISSLSENCSQ